MVFIRSPHGLKSAGLLALLLAMADVGAVAQVAQPQESGTEAKFALLPGQTGATDKTDSHSGRTKASPSVREAIARRIRRPALDFTMTTFGEKEGAPTFIGDIAQTRDGFLWLAAEEGVFRFDGVAFVKVGDTPEHHDSASVILTDKSGDLWVGYRHGGVERISNGNATVYDRGLPQLRSISALARDPSGSIWASTSAGLFRMEKGVWSPAPTPAGADASKGVLWVTNLADGRLCVVSSSDKAWFWNDQHSTFDPANPQKLTEDLYGVSTTGVPDSKRDEVDAALSLQALHTLTSIDATGAVWSLMSGPLKRYRGISGKEAFTEENFTASAPRFIDSSTKIFIDQEGNIWVGQADGLVQFRPNKLQAFTARGEVLAPSLTKGAQDDLWITSRVMGHVVRLSDDRVVDKFSLDAFVNNVTVDRDGTVWFLTTLTADHKEASITVWKKGQITKVPYPANAPGSRSMAIIESERGDHLLGNSKGQFRYVGDRWVEGFGYDALPAEGAFRFVRDDQGRIWIGYPDNSIGMIDRGTARVFNSSNGIHVGFVQAIDAKAQHAWIAGTNGVCLLREGRCTPVAGAKGEQFEGATGIVESKGGDLWINAHKGIYRISGTQIVKSIEGGPADHLEAELFGPRDGLQGGGIDPMPGPTALEDHNGRLWFARNEGANWIDPKKMIQNLVAPVPVVDSITVDGVSASLSNARLSPHPHSLKIDYTAASLTMPSSVTFQYRLAGVDTDWQDAGSRRQAYYTDLGPGHYAFELRAENEDGVQNVQDATLNLDVQPAYYQTWWFKLICAGIFGLLIALLYRLRIAQMRSRLRLQLEAKHEERERIARDLHDTLMQGMHGLVLQVDVWSSDPKIDSRHRQIMAGAANAALDLLTEGRDKIVALRSPSNGSTGLKERLEQVARECTPPKPVTFSVRQSDEKRPLHSNVAEEVFQIGREAIKNAFVHANARTIAVSIDYGEKAFVLLVSDDGLGLPPEILGKGAKAMHWGLPGMRERATTVNGQLTLRSTDASGTTVELVIPGKVAYAKPTNDPFSE